jgi:hypothetical protein
MKMLILGATGPTGRHLVDVGLGCGDSLTALVRNPGPLDDLADQITVVKVKAIRRALPAPDLPPRRRGRSCFLPAKSRSCCCRGSSRRCC